MATPAAGAPTTLRINLWSGPRNLSTALMYSWRSRADTTVVDEPLYAHYLSEVGHDLALTGRQHPGADDVMRSQMSDGARVVQEQILGPWPTPVVFFKQMAKHLTGLGPEVTRQLLGGCTNVLLTRNPRDMLLSFQQQVPNAMLADTGLHELVGLAQELDDQGLAPIVINSDLLLQDPESVLAQLCQNVGVQFDPAMLSWPAGPKEEDGVWAQHWYHAVHQSTGFVAPRPREGELSLHLQSVLSEANALYDRLVPWCIEP